MNDQEKAALIAEYQNALKSKLPEEIKTALKETQTSLGVDTSDLVAQFVATLHNPIVAKQPEPGRYIVALRSVRAVLANRAFGPESYDFDFQPVAPAQPPMANKNSDGSIKDYRVRVAGLGRSKSAKVEFEGPTTLMVYGFGDEKSAGQYGAQFRPGHVYTVRARVGDKSPKGRLGPGQVGFLNAGAADPVTQIPEPNGSAWPDPYARYAECVALTPIAELAIKPQKYAVYRIEGEIQRAWSGTTNGRQSGSIALIDDSISGNKQALELMKGGLGIFLPSDQLQLTKLPVGSRVGAIVSGYPKKKKDSSGNTTGDEQWSFNATVLQVQMDLSGGTSLAEPNKAALNIPEGQPGASADVNRDMI